MYTETLFFSGREIKTVGAGELGKAGVSLVTGTDADRTKQLELSRAYTFTFLCIFN